MPSKFLIFLLIIAALFALYSWNPKACFDPDELFYYKSSQSIKEFKDMFAPQYFGQPRFQKPPLFYMTLAFSYKIFGVNWFSARLFTIVSAILLLVVTYLTGARMFGREKAFFGSAVLGTTMLFFRFARVALPEMTLILFVSLALLFAYIALSENKKRYFYFSFLMMGIALLVKGPVGFVLPMLTIFFFQFMRRKTAPVQVPYLQGFLIMAVFLVAWLGPTFYFYRQAFTEHMVNIEIMDRLLRERVCVSGGCPAANFLVHYVKKIVYYVPVTLAQFLPWTVIIPLGMAVFRKSLEKGKYARERQFLAAWTIAGFLIYTLVLMKRFHYVLSFFPAMSLCLVSYFEFTQAAVRKYFQIFLSAVLAGYFVIVAVLFPYIFIDGTDRLSVRLSSVLPGTNADVLVSWRLDPQEVELYLDRPVIVLSETGFTQTSSPEEKKLLDNKKSETGPDSYLLTAEDEYNMYFKAFIDGLSREGGREYRYEVVASDRIWRKTVKIQELYREMRKDPLNVLRHLAEYFKEEVYLIVIR